MASYYYPPQGAHAPLSLQPTPTAMPGYPSPEQAYASPEQAYAPELVYAPGQAYVPATSNLYPEPQVNVSQVEEYPDEYPDYDDAAKGDNNGNDELDSDRPQHKSALSSIIMLLGYAIGIGNLWRFPYLVGMNGGGAFLIPYIFFLVVVASPAYLLEMIIGQKFQMGAIGAYGSIHPAGRGIGLAMMTMVVMVVSYYNVLLMWALHYIFDSFSSPLPWAADSDAYFTDEVMNYLPIDAAGTWSIPGDMVGISVLLYVLTYLALFKGIHNASKVATVMVILPVVFMTVLFFRMILLEGAGDGILFYVTPRVEYLWKFDTWRLALGQILFSLSPGMGTALALTSYNPKTTNIFRNNILVSIANSSFSIFCGFVVFSVVGHMTWLENQNLAEGEEPKTIDDIAQAGTKLAFVVFAKAVSLLPLPQLWSILFFLVLLTLGMDSTIALLEAVNAVMRDYCVGRGWPAPTAIITYITLVTTFLCGLPYITRGGLNWLDIIDHYVGTVALVLMVCIEVVFVWVHYGFPQLVTDLYEMTGVQMSRPVRAYYLCCWTLIPFITLGLFASFIYTDFVEPYGGYPWWALMVGWFAFMIPMGLVLFYFIYHCFFKR